MAKGIDFPQANLRLGPPPGMTEEQVYTLPTYRCPQAQHMISCWQLSPEELAEVQRIGKVWLIIWTGSTHPPVCVAGIDPFSEREAVS